LDFSIKPFLLIFENTQLLLHQSQLLLLLLHQYILGWTTYLSRFLGAWQYSLSLFVGRLMNLLLLLVMSFWTAPALSDMLNRIVLWRNAISATTNTLVAINFLELLLLAWALSLLIN
jgi:hypothetical protein